MTVLSHRQARAYLQAALDDALPPEQAAALDRHLAGCAACRAYADDLDQLQTSLRQIGERHRRQVRAAPAPDLAGRVRGQLQPMSIRLWPALKSGLASAGSLMLLAALLWRMLLAPGAPGQLETDGGAFVPADAPAVSAPVFAPAAHELPFAPAEFDQPASGAALRLVAAGSPEPEKPVSRTPLLGAAASRLE